MKGIHREIVYAHPPERVWQALTDPELLGLWLMRVEEFEPRVGCRFRFLTDPAPGFDGVIHCEVIELEPPRRFVHTWASGKRQERPTRVTWQLVPEGPGITRLILDHDGFAGVSGLFLRTLLGRGWGHKLRHAVPRLLDRLGRM